MTSDDHIEVTATFSVADLIAAGSLTFTITPNQLAPSSAEQVPVTDPGMNKEPLPSNSPTPEGDEA